MFRGDLGHGEAYKANSVPRNGYWSSLVPGLIGRQTKQNQRTELAPKGRGKAMDVNARDVKQRLTSSAEFSKVRDLEL